MRSSSMAARPRGGVEVRARCWAASGRASTPSMRSVSSVRSRSMRPMTVACVRSRSCTSLRRVRCRSLVGRPWRRRPSPCTAPAPAVSTLPMRSRSSFSATDFLLGLGSGRGTASGGSCDRRPSASCRCPTSCAALLSAWPVPGVSRLVSTRLASCVSSAAGRSCLRSFFRILKISLQVSSSEDRNPFCVRAGCSLEPAFQWDKQRKREDTLNGKPSSSAEQKQDKGFTLVELLIVIVILGILATVTVFAVRGITDQGKTSACEADQKTLETAIEAYFAKNNVDSGQRGRPDPWLREERLAATTTCRRRHPRRPQQPQRLQLTFSRLTDFLGAGPSAPALDPVTISVGDHVREIATSGPIASASR